MVVVQGVPSITCIDCVCQPPFAAIANGLPFYLVNMCLFLYCSFPRNKNSLHQPPVAGPCTLIINLINRKYFASTPPGHSLSGPATRGGVLAKHCSNNRSSLSRVPKISMIFHFFREISIQINFSRSITVVEIFLTKFLPIFRCFPAPHSPCSRDGPLRSAINPGTDAP